MASGIFIANPSTGGSVTSAFASTLSESITTIVDHDLDWRYINVDSADIVMARNILAHSFLQDKTCDRILFVDSDMKVHRSVLDKFLSRDADIVGAVYTTRTRNWDQHNDALVAGDSAKQAVAKSSEFNVKLIPGKVSVKSGFCQAAAFGFGYVLIKRALLERMINAAVVKPLVSKLFRRTGMTGEAFDFFGLIGQPDGDLLSEDYSFCQRVHDLGDTPLLAYTGDGVSHVGRFEYQASFVEWLKSKADK